MTSGVRCRVAPRSGVRSCDSSSRFRKRRGDVMRARLKLRSALLVGSWLVIAGAWTASAQTTPDPADAFFDDSVVHEIRLAINTKDWNTLKSNYLLNDYYPCDFKWGSVTVRNIGVRSRGTGSRSGVKPGLRVDFDRYTTNQKFLGLKIGRAS